MHTPSCSKSMESPSHLRDLLSHKCVWLPGGIGCDLQAHAKVLGHFHSLLRRYKDGGFIHIYHVHGDGGRGSGESDFKRGHICHCHIQDVLLLGLKIQALRNRKTKFKKIHSVKKKQQHIHIKSFLIINISVVLKPDCSKN